MKPSKPDLNPWKYAGLATALGSDLVVCILLGYFGGRFLSGYTGQKGWLAGGVLAGLFIGLVSIVFIIKRFVEDTNE